VIATIGVGGRTEAEVRPDRDGVTASEHKHGPQIGVGLFCSGGKLESARALTWSLNEIVVRDRRGLCT
jgi:hypothetical protein